MRLPRQSARLLAGALLTTAPLAPAPASSQPVQTEVRQVRFEGNSAFPVDSLSRAIVTRRSVCPTLFQPFCWVGLDFGVQRSFLSARELSNDRRRLLIWYRQRGFREVQVDTSSANRVNGAADVVFRITEGRPVLVDSLSFTGPDSILANGLLDDLPLGVGDRLDALRLDATRETLRSRLRNRGYAHAGVYRIVAIPSGSYAASVVFEVEPGPLTSFGEITVDSLTNLSRTTVLRTLPFGPGDLFRADLLREGQARLFGLGVVQSASVQADTTAWGEPVVPITVHVAEGDVHRVRAGAGWSTAECLDAEARWTSRNFRGGGRTLEVRARLANVLASGFHEILCTQAGDSPFNHLNWLMAVDFTQPWIGSTRNSFTASLFGERQSLPDVFVRRAVGVDLGFTRVLGSRTPMRLSWAPELSTLSAADILFCTGFLICTPEDIDLLQSANWLAPLGFNLTSTETDNLLNPTRGYIFSLALEHADGWTGSSFRYDRALVEGTWYEGVAPGGVLAARLRTGWVGSGGFSEALGGTGGSGVIHPEKRFYAGGANSVRGFPQSRLGPRVLVLDEVTRLLEDDPETTAVEGCDPEEVIDLSCDPANVAENAFNPRPTGGTRVMEGNLELRLRLSPSFQAVTFTDFGQVWGVDEPADLATVELTPGVGIRFLSPIGPLRVDLAYRFRGGSRLPVVTSQLRPIVGQEPGIPVGNTTIPYVESDELALLTTPYLYAESEGFSLSRLQLHLSIGQAF